MRTSTTKEIQVVTTALKSALAHTRRGSYAIASRDAQTAINYLKKLTRESLR